VPRRVLAASRSHIRFNRDGAVKLEVAHTPPPLHRHGDMPRGGKGKGKGKATSSAGVAAAGGNQWETEACVNSSLGPCVRATAIVWIHCASPTASRLRDKTEVDFYPTPAMLICCRL
jgi:hypothetical protein